MPLWLLLIPGGLLIWLLAQHSTEERLRRHEMPPQPPRGPSAPSRFPLVRPAASSPARPHTASDYLRHLNECCWAARVLDGVKPYALLADVPTLMSAPDEVSHAIAVLCQPMETLFLQRDLNVLGSEPPVPEDGRMGRETEEALRALQGALGQHPSGALDQTSAAAVRYAVGCVYSQDKAAHGG